LLRSTGTASTNVVAHSTLDPLLHMLFTFRITANSQIAPPMARTRLGPTRAATATNERRVGGATMRTSRSYVSRRLPLLRCTYSHSGALSACHCVMHVVAAARSSAAIARTNSSNRRASLDNTARCASLSSAVRAATDATSADALVSVSGEAGVTGADAVLRNVVGVVNVNTTRRTGVAKATLRAA
jgi:hypothetical protein